MRIGDDAFKPVIRLLGPTGINLVHDDKAFPGKPVVVIRVNYVPFAWRALVALALERPEDLLTEGALTDPLVLANKQHAIRHLNARLSDQCGAPAHKLVPVSLVRH